jgi:hypothetical protein
MKITTTKIALILVAITVLIQETYPVIAILVGLVALGLLYKPLIKECDKDVG